MEIAFPRLPQLSDQLFTRSRLVVPSLSSSFSPRIWTRWDRVPRVLVSTQSVAILRRILQDRGNAAGDRRWNSREMREQAVRRDRSVGPSVGPSVGRSVGQSLGEGEGVAHASGTHPRQHRVRMADVDLGDCHVAGEELGQDLDARSRSTIERVAHGPRVRIFAVPQAAEAHRVLASGRFLLLHLHT